MRALFFGTPAFAVPCLDALVRIAEVKLVVSQPDRPSGRGLAVTPTPVKARALELGLPVEQPTKVKAPELAERLAALSCDVAVVVAYGRILPRTVLDTTRMGFVNVHGSILPRWRGAAPIQWSILSGDAETGVSLMLLDEGMDTGPVISTLSTKIDPDETSSELGVRLSALGAELLERDLPRFVAGELPAVPQDHARATHARMLEKTDGAIDFRKPARAIHDHVRGMSPWPGASCAMRGERVKIHATRVVRETGKAGRPGTLLSVGPGGIEVACGDGVLALETLQLEGRKKLPASDFAKGVAWHAPMQFDGAEG